MMAAVAAGLALVAATALGVRRPGLGPAALLAVACVTWLLLNGPLEGPVLLVLAAGHGLTLADLLVPCAALTMLVASARARAARKRRRARSTPGAS